MMRSLWCDLGSRWDDFLLAPGGQTDTTMLQRHINLPNKASIAGYETHQTFCDPHAIAIRKRSVSRKRSGTRTSKVLRFIGLTVLPCQPLSLAGTARGLSRFALPGPQESQESLFIGVPLRRHWVNDNSTQPEKRLSQERETAVEQNSTDGMCTSCTMLILELLIHLSTM